MWVSLGLALFVTGQAAMGPDRPTLAGDVKLLAAPGIPGDVVVFGGRAVPVVVGRVNPGDAAVVAVGSFGRGRVAAFGHTGYLDPATWSVGQTAQVMERTLVWLANKPQGLRIGAIGAPGFQSRLGRLGTLRELQPSDPIENLDVLLVQQADLPAETVSRVERFVRQGGGLLASATGWGWEMVTGRPISDMPINRVLRLGGLTFGNAMLDRTHPDGFDVARAPGEHVHAGVALDQGQTQLTPQAADTIVRAVTAMPANDRSFLPRVEAFRKRLKEPGIPGPQHPIKRENGLMRLAVALDTLDGRRAAPRQVRAHPAARLFPGEVPASAPRIRATRSLSGRTPGWHSLGLYAAPGEVVRVKVDPAVVGKGLTVQIGSHTDSLWHLESWKRMPEVVRRFPVNAAEIEVASAFGGLIYVDMPERAPSATVSVEFVGVVEAPLFMLGKTSAADWARLRQAPGPWAEIGSDRVIITVPSSVVRNLEKPEEVAKFWDRVADVCADLVSWPRERRRPERMVADEQISAGYMHSGYPIMTHLDVKEMVVDVNRLMKEGSWGHFHELGHNHQHPDWTFEGTGEVTVNLFSMYVYQQVLGQQFDQGHPAIRNRKERTDRVLAYLRDGAKFEKWQSDPFLALTMYIQVIEGFGWQPILDVLREYRGLPEAQRPQSEMDKRDQWMVRLSRRVGRDLGPFFVRWGVPTSEAARSSIAGLPDWMPEELK